MKAREHKDLERLIDRYESHHHHNALSMNVLAIFGLISFALMAVPIFTTHAPNNLVVYEKAPEAKKVFGAVSIQAHSAVVYDLTTNTILYGQQENAVVPLASLTKLFTVYSALTGTEKTALVTLSERDLAPEGDSGLQIGETFTLGSLERLALVASSNDAAEAVGEATQRLSSGTHASLMASAISALGITDVKTANATGLDVSTTVSGGYGSALSVAKVAKSIVTLDPGLGHATTESSVTVHSRSGTTHTLMNTNQSLASIPSPLLSKTGLTDLAGGNLVVVFDVGINHPVAVVVLGSTKEGRFEDVSTLVRKTLAYFAPAKAESPAP